MPIYENKDKTYKIIVRYKDAFNKPKQTTIRRNNFGNKIVTKREAKKIEREFLTSAENQFTDNITYEELFELNIQKPNLSERTRSNKRRDYQIHIKDYFGHLKIKSIQPYQVMEWQKYLLDNLNPNSARSVYATFKSIINHGIKYHGLVNNPCRSVEAIKRAKPKVSYITTIQLTEIIKKFVAVSDDILEYYEILTETLFFTGLRIGEALVLRWSDLSLDGELEVSRGLDINNNIINEWTKTDAGYRTMSPPTPLIDKLLKIKKKQKEKIYGWAENMFIFGGIDFIKYGTYHSAFNKARIKAGFNKLRIHDLRHSFAAFNINCNVDIYTLKELMGHEDIKVTVNTYGHLYPEKRLVAKEKQEQAILEAGYIF